MAVVVDEQQALDSLTRACLRTLADAADAHRLDTPEARDVARQIVRDLLHQASGAIANPIEARRAVERYAEVVDALLATVAPDHQDDGRRVQVEPRDR